MKSFGPYQIIQELSHQRGTVIHKARDASSEVIVKVFHLAHFADGNPKKVEELSKTFYRTVEMQKNVAGKSAYVMPILCYGMEGEAAWEASPIYENSIQKLLAARTPLTRDNFQKIIESVLQGAMDIKEHYGRSHGNLKPTNVLFNGDAKTKLADVVVSDPAPGDGAQSEKLEVADLHAIGQLIYLLLTPAETRDPSTWRLSATQPPPAWTRFFGSQASAWINLCTRLLDPELTAQTYSLEKLALDLLKLKPAASSRKPMALVGATAAVALVAAGGFFFIKSSSSKTSGNAPSQTTIVKVTDTAALREKEEAAQKAEAEAQRLAEEKRLAEQRAASASRESENVRLQAEREARRLSEEKRLLESREAEARKEAAAKTAELEQLRHVSDTEKEAADRQAAELKRQVQEAKAREIAAELARKQELQRTASAPAPDNVTRPVSTTTERPSRNRPWINTLGMRFAPVGNSQILVSTWETRRKDFEEFAQSSRQGVDSGWKKTSFQQNGQHPVVNVTASDAAAFCEWLTQSERSKGLLSANQFYRLPTHTEWTAVAAKAPSDSTYSWGNVWPPPSGIGNYGPTYSYDRFDFTAPVGQFQPNAAGIYDLAGNVWEICQSGSDLCSALGGSWLTVTPDQLSLSASVQLSPKDKREDIGFRCVLDLGR